MSALTPPTKFSELLAVRPPALTVALPLAAKTEIIAPVTPTKLASVRVSVLSPAPARNMVSIPLIPLR